MKKLTTLHLYEIPGNNYRPDCTTENVFSGRMGLTLLTHSRKCFSTVKWFIVRRVLMRVPAFLIFPVSLLAMVSQGHTFCASHKRMGPNHLVR